MQSCALLGRKQDRIAERELVLGQGPGLVRAQNVDPGHFLDGGQLGDDRLLFRQRQRAQCHGDGEHRRHGHRDRCDQQNEDELQDAERVFESPVVGDDDVLIDLDGDHDQRQRDGDDDQEVPDLEHRPLGVADGAGAGHELGGAAEERVGAGRDDDALHLALLDDAARIGLVADLLRNRQGFARQRRLVDGGVIAADKPQVGGHDDAEPDLDDVAGHQRRSRNRLPLAVAHHGGLGGEPLPQRGQRIGGLAVLPEFEPGVEEQQRRDDGEIVPMPDDRRNDRGGLDHIGVRPGEVPHDLAEQTDLFFNEGVGAVLGEPLPRLDAAQSLLGLDGELGKDLLDRQLLEVDRGMRADLVRSCGGLQGNGGHGLLLGTRSRIKKNGFPKLTKCGLMIEIKDQPTRSESTYSARMVAD